MRRVDTRRAEVGVGVRFALCDVGPHFGTHAAKIAAADEVQVLPGLGDAETTERPLQFLVVHGGNGDGRVALLQPDALMRPPVLQHVPADPTVVAGGAVMDGRRGNAHQGRIPSGGGNQAEPIALADRVLLPGGGRGTVALGGHRCRRGVKILLPGGAYRVDDLVDGAAFLHMLPAIYRAVVRRSRIRLLRSKISVRLRLGDTQSLDVNVYQEVQLPLHGHHLMETKSFWSPNLNLKSKVP